ncbi:hypothetical protein CASFOL_014385 [Castilleja foliolosa]|uniref:Uncharacterized protein n=1 Tax=Castilleja foliolosa TaxID=1961234 RepID=A0ABD3DRU7_9LAMI
MDLKGQKGGIMLLVRRRIHAIEATTDVKHIEHFDSLIQLQLCYKVSNYICTGARTYMATVEHVASLVIVQKAGFEHVPNLEIPSVYFNFATYETIKKRIKDTKLLTVHWPCRKELYAFYKYRKTATKNPFTRPHGKIGGNHSMARKTGSDKRRHSRRYSCNCINNRNRAQRTSATGVNVPNDSSN